MKGHGHCQTALFTLSGRLYGKLTHGQGHRCFRGGFGRSLCVRPHTDASAMVAAQVPDLRAKILMAGVYDLREVYQVSSWGLHVDGRTRDCILRLYRSALNVGREWQPGLANITAPTLVIHSRKDRPVPPKMAEALAADIGARAPVLLDAGHWYPLQRPDEMARALNTFWSS